MLCGQEGCPVAVRVTTNDLNPLTKCYSPCLKQFFYLLLLAFSPLSACKTPPSCLTLLTRPVFLQILFFHLYQTLKTSCKTIVSKSPRKEQIRTNFTELLQQEEKELPQFFSSRFSAGNDEYNFSFSNCYWQDTKFWEFFICKQ